MSSLAAAAPDLAPGIAATVNRRPISEKVVQALIANDCVALQIDPRTDEGKKKLPKVRAAVLDELIDRTLIAQETEKRGIAPTNEEVAAAEKNAIEFWGTQDRYAEFLKSNSFTREEYRELVLRSAAAGKALTAGLTKAITVTPEEVRDYYQKNPRDPALQWPERVTASHILFNTRPRMLAAELKLSRKLTDGPELEKAVAEETAGKQKLADTVRAEAAKTGADFAALAKKYSDDSGTRDAGGSLGTFPKGSHAPELDDAAFALHPGEVSPVIHSDSGFHIVKVFDHRPAGRRTLEEAEPLVRQKLLRMKQANALKDWLAQARTKATIVIAKNPAPEPSSTP